MIRSTFAAAAAAVFVLGGCASMGSPKPIPATLASTPQLSTLNKLVLDAGLADTLSGPGPYTVFAPTDDAFKAVPAATLAALSNDKELLKSVLSYHVVPAKLLTADITNGTVKSVQGAALATSRSGSFVTVEDAVVSQTDVIASNGVVQIIDKVMMPPKK